MSLSQVLSWILIALTQVLSFRDPSNGRNIGDDLCKLLTIKAGFRKLPNKKFPEGVKVLYRTERLDEFLSIDHLTFASKDGFNLFNFLRLDFITTIVMKSNGLTPSSEPIPTFAATEKSTLPVHEMERD